MHASLILLALPLAFARPSHLRREEPAPVLRPRGAEVIPNKYIVKLKEGGGDFSIQSSLNILPVEPEHVYDSKGFKGFAAELDDNTVAALQEDPNVSSHGISDDHIGLEYYINQTLWLSIGRVH